MSLLINFILHLFDAHTHTHTHTHTLSLSLFQVVEEVEAYTLTPKDALHIKANDNYTDQFGKTRNIGEEWLVTSEDTESYIPDVTEVRITLYIKRCVYSNCC